MLRLGGFLHQRLNQHVDVRLAVLVEVEVRVGAVDDDGVDEELVLVQVGLGDADAHVVTPMVLPLVSVSTTLSTETVPLTFEARMWLTLPATFRFTPSEPSKSL